MAKGYWITVYKSASDDKALGEYARLAGPAIAAGGGKFLARGIPSKVYEGGVMQRTVIIEFDSVDAAVKTHDSPGYQEALRALGKTADREIRIIEAA